MASQRSRCKVWNQLIENGSMRSSLLVITFLLHSFLSRADLPPCWCGFRVDSENEEYFAWLTPNINDSLDKPWDVEWQICVFKLIESDSVEQWRSEYIPSGYREGILSNDGKDFVTVSYWFHSDVVMVMAYNENGLSCDINTAELLIGDDFLYKTVSHVIWRKNYFFEKKKGNTIIIETFDGSNRRLVIDECRIEKVKD